MKNQNMGGLHYYSRLSVLLLSLSCLLLYCNNIQGQSPAIGSVQTGLHGMNQELESRVKSTLRESSRTLQLIENNGQEGLPETVIAYFSSRYETVFIQRDRLRIVIASPVISKTKSVAHNEKADLQTTYRSNSFEIRFCGASIAGKNISTDQFPTKRNFIAVRNRQISSVSSSSSSEIILQQVYPGIDLRLYSQQNGHLEFDWIIWPKADVRKIRMKFSGQKKLERLKNGSLRVGMAMGDFLLRLPESYYVTPAGKKMAAVQFDIQHNGYVRFKTAQTVNSIYPLVIDPDLLWGTFFDGDNTDFDEYLYGITYSPAEGKIYCAGAASLQVSVLYAAALSHAYDSTFAATPDVLIYALTKDGQFITQITYLGGAGADVGVGIALTDSLVYVSGYTSSADFPVTLAANGQIPAFDSVYHGNTDGFIAVLNHGLDSLFYCSYLGGDGMDKALTIRAFQDSTFYISLSATDTLPLASPSYIASFADDIFEGNSEAWIARFSSFNQLDFGTYIGGSSDDLINDFQVLSDSDIVFAGNTRNITEINGSIPDNGTGQEALFGRINVPSSGPVSFDILDKIGGSGSDYAWGILSMGDSVSILVGQTSSNNFPLGTGPVFQNTRAGQIDGFIAKLYNDGSPGYKATFTGGSDDEILVSVRPVVVNNQIALLSWGTTGSTDLQTRNFNSGTFFSNSNAGGLDMLFVICDFNLSIKYYLSYIGGSRNDYLGATGAPVGSNHLYYNVTDSALYLGTTTHSNQSTHIPLFVGRGPADYLNDGVPVFDETKGNGNNDTHVIIALSMRGLYGILASGQISLSLKQEKDCSSSLQWNAEGQTSLSNFIIEKSKDGRLFSPIGSVQGNGSGQYHYADKTVSASAHSFYRIKYQIQGMSTGYSNTAIVRPCNPVTADYRIYPSVFNNNITVSGLLAFSGEQVIAEFFDSAGRLVLTLRKTVNGGSEIFTLPSRLLPGTYFIRLKRGSNEEVICQRTVVSAG